MATGIAVLAGLICFVLRLFTQNRSPHHFANANLAPPILFASDTGMIQQDENLINIQQYSVLIS